MLNTRNKQHGLLACLFLICLHTNSANAQDTEELAVLLKEARAQIKALESRIERLENSQPIEVSAREEQQQSLSPIVTELEERVEELEIVTTQHDESIGSRAVASAFDGLSLDIGGFFDTTSTIAIGENATDASFNRQTFELLLKADLGSKWDLFLAQAFTRNAPLNFIDPQQRTTPNFDSNNSEVETDTVVAWAQYKHKDILNVQFGRFITPHGIINIEHFPASLLDTEQPQFLRPFNAQNIFANFTNGINVYGSKYLGNSTVTYAAYAGVWAGNSSNPIFGGRLDYKIGNSGFTFGVNGFSGDRVDQPTDSRYYGGGIDVLFDKGPLLWKNELYTTSEGNGQDRIAFYTQPSIRLSNSLTVLYRFDLFDDDTIGGRSIEHVGGLVFDPIDNVRLRAVYRLKRLLSDPGFDDADVNIIQLATTFNF